MNSSKFKNLIVGVDFSPYSKIVVKEAQLLSQKMKIPVTYVHVLKDLKIYRDFLGFARPGVMEEFEKKVRKIYRLKSDAHILVEFGPPAEKMIELAKNMESPLIFVGCRGGHAFSKFFLGSTAEALAFTSPFPVWIHRGNHVKIPKKFLMPSDLSLESDKAILDVEAFRQEMKAKLQLHHVFQEPMPILDYPDWQNLNKRLRREDSEDFSDFSKKHSQLKITKSVGFIANEIQKKSKRFDLLALKPKRSGHKRMVIGGVMTKVIRSAETPVLVLP